MSSNTSTPKKWQWVSDAFGPMGWFSPAEKAAHEGTPEFMNGKWVPVERSERDAFNRWVGHLAHSQA